MNMTADRIAISCDTKDSHCGHSARLRAWHALHWFVHVVINIYLLEC